METTVGASNSKMYRQKEILQLLSSSLEIGRRAGAFPSG